MNNCRVLRCSARQLGFTLLELMITVAIIAIVAAIAIPSYGEYVKKSRRADGMSELSRLMQRQEKYFINYLEYSTDFADLGITGGGDEVESSAGYYLIKASACTDSTIARCVILTGTPTGTQADDGWLSINSRGQRDWERNLAGETGWP